MRIGIISSKEILLLFPNALLAAVIGALIYAVIDPDYRSHSQMPISILFFSFFALLHCALLAVPVVWVLRKFREWSLLSLSVSGMVTTGAPWLIFIAPERYFGEIAIGQMKFIGMVGFFGLIGAIIFWGLLLIQKQKSTNRTQDASR